MGNKMPSKNKKCYELKIRVINRKIYNFYPGLWNEHGKINTFLSIKLDPVSSYFIWLLFEEFETLRQVSTTIVVDKKLRCSW